MRVLMFVAGVYYIVCIPFSVIRYNVEHMDIGYQSISYAMHMRDMFRVWQKLVEIHGLSTDPPFVATEENVIVIERCEKMLGSGNQEVVCLNCICCIISANILPQAST